MPYLCFCVLCLGPPCNFSAFKAQRDSAGFYETVLDDVRKLFDTFKKVFSDQFQVLSLYLHFVYQQLLFVFMHMDFFCDLLFILNLNQPNHHNNMSNFEMQRILLGCYHDLKC